MCYILLYNFFCTYILGIWIIKSHWLYDFGVATHTLGQFMYTGFIVV